MQEYRSCKLQSSVSRTSLQIDMQNFVSTKSDLLATKNEVIFTKIWDTRFIISATICLWLLKLHVKMCFCQDIYFAQKWRFSIAPQYMHDK